MTWYPISYYPPQFIDSSGAPYSGAVLKAYADGTSTPISMAIDYLGATTAVTLTLNASGYPSYGGAVVIPHVEENFKLALYPTQAAADANSGAIFNPDNIQITSASLLNSPEFTGTPTAPTATAGTSTTQVATTEFVCETIGKQGNETNGFRLSLTSATPVTTGDVTGATTIYAVPYKSNNIALYDGTNWNIRNSSEFSLALGTLTSGKPYDVFCYDNSTIPTLEFLVWTDDTTRATALAYQNGVLVKSGDATRRYLGSFYTTSTTTTEDSAVKRYLFNAYNEVERSFLRRESAASWTYTTATVRQANGNTANQIEFMRGLNEHPINVSLTVYAQQGGANNFAAGLGLDSTTTINAGQGAMGFAGSPPGTARYNGLPGLGRHYVAWLETSVAAGTTTWYGNITAAGATVYSGLSGSMLA